MNNVTELKVSYRTYAVFICALTSFFLFIFLSESVVAKSRLAIGQKVYERMQEAQVEIEAKNYNEAIEVLDEILLTKRLNNYEKSQVLSMHGNVYFQKEDFDRSLDAFKKVVAFDNLPEGFLLISLKTLTQLSFMQDKYADAILYGNKMLSITEVPDATIYMLLAQVYYRKEDYEKSLEHAQTAIKIKKKLGGATPENWLLVLNAIYYSTGQYKSMVTILKELIELYPKESYVMNLAAIYGQLEQPKKQLLLMEPLYDKGYIKSESQLINLAHLMLMHKVPYKGAKIIEQGFRDGTIERTKKNLELLGQSWQMAAEDDRSVEYLAEAAKTAKNGKIYVRLAQSYMNLYRWEDAEAALEKALKKGGLKKEGNAQLLLGMVRFYQKEYRTSRKAFRAASEFDETQKLAEQWITFVEQEREKHDQGLQ